MKRKINNLIAYKMCFVAHNATVLSRILRLALVERNNVVSDKERVKGDYFTVSPNI
jgi:carbonic anhydrase/acetyltransferase-like protein (isoleucine patch superfamily)